MVLPISMSVHEIQCGSLALLYGKFGYKKSGHHGIFDLRLAWPIAAGYTFFGQTQLFY